MTIEDGARYMPTDRVALQRVDEELVLLDLESGEFLVARGLGALVWERLARGEPVTRIVEEVAGHYGREMGEVRADIDAFVTSLLERSFIVPGEDG